ncbi:HDIG domain-containing metalloprotein [Patescibacteria group bacterium]
MTRKKALELLHKNMKNINLRRHCYAVEATMRALAERLYSEKPKKELKKIVDNWGIAGLLHDSDYELTKETAKKDHTKKTLKWLKAIDADASIYDAVAAHAWNYVDGAPKPKTKMDWALYTCDELTGLIVAVALVKPEKKLSSVTVDSVIKKWKQKSFAAGVDRAQIEDCELRLGIELRNFIDITLSAMQGIHDDLGL